MDSVSGFPKLFLPKTGSNRKGKRLENLFCPELLHVSVMSVAMTPEELQSHPRNMFQRTMYPLYFKCVFILGKGRELICGFTFDERLSRGYAVKTILIHRLFACETLAGPNFSV
jgi:hypothetical protein